MWGLRRRRRRSAEKVEAPVLHAVPPLAGPEEKPDTALPKNPYRLTNNTITDFALHISKYIGQTVTIFVAGGGASGLGFTGVLAGVTAEYIKLITKLGPAPACSLGSACLTVRSLSYNFYPYYYRYFGMPGYGAVNTVGSVACIPVSRIVSFVHSSI